MARALWVVVMSGWLIVLVRTIRRSRRSRGDLRLLTALEALRRCKTT